MPQTCATCPATGASSGGEAQAPAQAKSVDMFKRDSMSCAFTGKGTGESIPPEDVGASLNKGNDTLEEVVTDLPAHIPRSRLGALWRKAVEPAHPLAVGRLGDLRAFETVDRVALDQHGWRSQHRRSVRLLGHLPATCRPVGPAVRQAGTVPQVRWISIHLRETSHHPERHRKQLTSNKESFTLLSQETRAVAGPP